MLARETAGPMNRDVYRKGLARICMCSSTRILPSFHAQRHNSPAAAAGET